MELTIQDLESNALACETRAGDYREAAMQLRTMLGNRELKLEAAATAVPPSPPRLSRREPVEKAGAGREGSMKAGTSGLRPTPETVRLMAVLGSLAEPFGAPDLAKAAGVGRVRAGNALQRAKEKRWIVKGEGWGRFVRTKEFPGTSVPANGGKAKGAGGQVRARQEPRPTDVEKVPVPSETERRYREMREGMGKIHVPRIGEGMRPDGEEEG